MDCENCGQVYDPVGCRWRCPHCGWKASCCEGEPMEQVMSDGAHGFDPDLERLLLEEEEIERRGQFTWQVTPGHPVMAGAGYDCHCGECLHLNVSLYRNRG